MFGCILASARDNAVEHAVGVNVRPSYIVPTHGFYNGYNPLGRPLRSGGSAHLNYSFSFSPESVLGSMYPGAYQGAGIDVQIGPEYTHYFIRIISCLVSAGDSAETNKAITC